MFGVQSTVTGSLSGLTITRRGPHAGAGIANLGTLTLNNDVISDCLPWTKPASATKVPLTINNSTITNNNAQYQAAGIRSLGVPLTITNSTISNNNAPARPGVQLDNGAARPLPSPTAPSRATPAAVVPCTSAAVG